MQLSAGGMPAEDSSHAQRVLSCLNQQRAAGRFCDAVLSIGDGLVYPAHRNLLACFSELVQLQSNMPPSPSTELCLQECPNDGLELLLDFVYTGELKLDPENLDKVQRAAVSLSVPEVLALCQKFREKSADPAPLKRKRGRPRKSAADTSSGHVKEENVFVAMKDEPNFEAAAASSSTSSTSTSTSTTTTRSGRLVKGPRRLVTDESPRPDLTNLERVCNSAPAVPVWRDGGGAEENQNETQASELQIDTREKDPVQVTDEAAENNNEEDDDGGYSEDVNEDTDEEYVPTAEPGPSASSTSASWRHRAVCKQEKMENGEAVEEDSKKESVRCPVCDKSFKSKYYLKVHNRRHTGERPFGCANCGKRYFRKENLLIHEDRNCMKAQVYTCGTCAVTFKGKEELRLHIVSHTGNFPYKCSTCSEQFMYKKNLSTHMMKIHGHPKPNACPQCPKTFLTKSELRVHEASKHRGEKPFVCEECGHRASSRNGLQMHIKAIHRNERPFVCTLCGHAFSQKNNLNMHLRVHSGERPYQCHLCGKTFRTQASLDKHNRTHTGERPFSCDLCEQRFTEKGALLRHKASKHEEGRPHCCHICGKTFKAKEQLGVHLRRHRGVRKFECGDCGYKFTRQAHLRRHVQIHKRTENYNPRQRRLRNVIVQELEGCPLEEDPTFEGEGTDFVPETRDVQESSNPGADSSVSSGCTVTVVMESRDAVIVEEVVSNQNLGHVEGEADFSVQEVLQETPLEEEEYGTTIDMEGMVENLSESKT